MKGGLSKIKGPFGDVREDKQMGGDGLFFCWIYQGKNRPRVPGRNGMSLDGLKNKNFKKK